ncbi:MAG TPA: DNA internalization-related competence protein ComEC/Rec2, partial [Thermoanaerobaculia bacterium]|nr:DNA internalization-related competence protein ComEC/Rec2 [Thermoanaerobaculia bacterium]
VALSAGALGLLWAELAWVAPIRASPGWDLERPVDALFVPDDAWEARDADWSARGRIERLTQQGRSETLDLAVRASISADALPAPASVYRMVGYLRAPLAFYNGEPTWTGSWQLRVKSARFVSPAEAARPPSMAQRARHRLMAGLHGAGKPATGAALLEGLLLGRTSALPEDWQRGLRRTGLMHLFAVSGLHVSLIAGVVWAVLAPLRAPARASAALLVATAYSLLVGLGPTVLRSLFMLGAVIAARLSRRAPSSLNALALSAGALTAMTPALVDDLSFQLTVAATAGVVGLGPWLAPRWGRGALAKALAISVGAQLATLPFTIPAFSQMPLLGAALNLVAVPWTGLCLIVGLVWAVVALIDPALGAALVPWFDPLARPFGWVAALPPYPLVSVPVALGAASATLLAIVLLGVASRPRSLLVVAPLVLALAVIARPRGFEATLLDVGQGDAILLRDGASALLIDGGGWPAGDFGGRVLLPALARLGVRSLEAAVVSHPDADHCAGLADLAAYIPIEQLWIAPGWREAPCLRRLTTGRLGSVRVLWRGDHFEWRGFSLEVLHPTPGERGAGNDRSLVLAAQAGGRSLLLTGDLPEDVETVLVRRRVLHPVSVLKVAHHGSRSSTSLPFLSSTAPRWALISAGRDNAYGHPSDLVLERLARRHAQVLRTDRNGRIRLRWHGGGPLRVEVSRAPVLGAARERVRLGPPRLVFDG